MINDSSEILSFHLFSSTFSYLFPFLSSYLPPPFPFLLLSHPFLSFLIPLLHPIFIISRFSHHLYHPASSLPLLLISVWRTSEDERSRSFNRHRITISHCPKTDSISFNLIRLNRARYRSNYYNFNNFRLERISSYCSIIRLTSFYSFKIFDRGKEISTE